MLTLASQGCGENKIRSYKNKLIEKLFFWKQAEQLFEMRIAPSLAWISLSVGGCDLRDWMLSGVFR